MAANWAFKTFGECVHDWRKLVRAKATERVGNVGNFDTHGFALFAEGTNFLGAAVGDLHQVDGNAIAKRVQCCNGGRKCVYFAMNSGEANHVDTRLLFFDESSADGACAVAALHYVFCVHHDGNSDGRRNVELLQERVGCPGSWAEVLVGFQLAKAHLDDVYACAHHGVDIVGDELVGIIPIVVIAAVAQRAIDKSYVARRCHCANSTCGVWLALADGFVYWHG